MATVQSRKDHSYRFGLNLFQIDNRDIFRAKCQRAERLGFDVLNLADHLHAPAPFSTAVAATEATKRVRVGTHVLNIAFWNPALLAREIATADLLTDGRLDIGLGGGTVKAEFDEAGIAWEPIEARFDRLAYVIGEIKRLLANATSEANARTPRPCQRPHPPILVGASGKRGLRVAADHADILGFGAVQQAADSPAGSLELMTALTADERMAYFRERAGDRVDEMQRSLLLQNVTLTAHRRSAAEKMRREMGSSREVDELLEAPGTLIGTIDEVVEQIHERAERYGFTYFSVHERSMDAMAEVIAALRADGQ